ncbi:hypothetical protein [Streptococcus oralis]|uniref:Uncharacterized protein n=1 Tax=Streptococcus oralis TaxID=1303 RepID=A0A139QMF0_STROR|nr:hypothetical protein [Streptococcus oralis]KXU03704.1 hypothetical protein SORDD24_01570 [Streptococcus oralis]
MTVLYYCFFIAKDRLKSIRENILYSKSLRKVLGNIVLCFISLIAVPFSYSYLLIYIGNWISMSLISSGLIENKIMQFMLLGFLLTIVIDTVVLLIISVLGSGALSLWIMARYSYELFGKELQDKKEKRVANLPDSKKESVNFLRYSLMILLAMILVVALLYIFNAELLLKLLNLIIDFCQKFIDLFSF